MKAIYSQEGKTIDYTNTTEKVIERGEVVTLAGAIGVAFDDILVGDWGALSIAGVYEMPAENTAPLAVGQKVYWNGTAVTGVASVAEVVAEAENKKVTGTEVVAEAEIKKATGTQVVGVVASVPCGMVIKPKELSDITAYVKIG